MKITHLITGLSTGGAEAMLHKLLSSRDRRRFGAEVISLTDIGPVGEKIRALGIPVRALGMRTWSPNPFGVARLARWLRRDPPDLLQTWMYHADFIGGVAARSIGRPPVVWNIRHGGSGSGKLTTRLTARLCARFSRSLPARIICCSGAARAHHAELGYASERMIVIPNGFDLSAFGPDPDARSAVRRELRIAPGVPLIGLVGRFRSEKDHETFFRAAGLLQFEISCAGLATSVFPAPHFLLCGEGVVWRNRRLQMWIEQAGIRNRCHLLGERADIGRINAALDIACSSSSEEGFSNTVGEAMACGVPCVVTDVGDSSMIVNDTGRVVRPRNPAALAHAWRELLVIGREGRRALGLAARRRIEERFSLPSIVARYERLYEEVISEARAGTRAAAPSPTQVAERSTEAPEAVSNRNSCC